MPRTIKTKKSAPPRKKTEAPRKRSEVSAKKTKTSPKIAKAPPKGPAPIRAGSVSIRMYRMGTGDCFLIQFHGDDDSVFSMMIDCGSCAGNKKDFAPYLDNLTAALHDRTLDLLIVTHEHNDHVNGFAKCYDHFVSLTIREAWFAWTEDPAEYTGAAAELKIKQARMKRALRNALDAFHLQQKTMSSRTNLSPLYKLHLNDQLNFSEGLETLASINLPGSGEDTNTLDGMRKIKEILTRKRTKIRYLKAGETVELPALPGLKFHVLGPPSSGTYIYKEGRQGHDIFEKYLQLDDSSPALNAFIGMGDNSVADVPFSGAYVASSSPNNQNDPNDWNRSYAHCLECYNDPQNDWRRIDDNWLNSAGALALRLNSHINNTSLVLAIESEPSKKVLLFPGDAEYGSWESWHLIPEWLTKGKDGKPWAEDLLNRTVFYKVSHHLSYNGTALQKGIRMMTDSRLAAMATLDLRRIAKRWTTTMPNKYLLKELTQLTQGKLFIMEEHGIMGPPSARLDPMSLEKDVYAENKLYKQYTVRL